MLQEGRVNGIQKPNLGSKVQQMVDEWMKLDKNPSTLSEIQRLADEGNEEELVALLGSRMAFGTAGLRAKMGAGFSRMNDLTIIQTTQGIACYLKEQWSDKECETRGVVIGYDARHNSLRFAELAAGILLHKGFKVYLFSTYTPTPFNPYAVKSFDCLAGIQITASHNPKEYNGYKVYWSNGSQIIPPHDVNISHHISANLTPWSTSWDTAIVKQQSSQIVDPLATVIKGYFNEIQQFCYRREENASLGLKFTFTPMHGVGGDAVKRAFKAFNLPEFVPVPEQIDPHPDFPTVVFPNPEEGKSALDLAMSTAKTAGSKVILAVDPDADRLAVAEKDPKKETWKIFSGNEIGALMGWWAFKNYKEKHPNFDGSKVHMLASTVSSKFLGALAEVEGFQFETLTGFKWMGNRSHDLMKNGHEVLFAFEEAIGFMFGTTVLDKDGISAAAVMAEFAGWLYSQGKSFHSQLEEIYSKYGRFVSEVSYYICYSKETIKELFNRLRAGRKYPTTCGSAKVVSVMDLTVGYDSSRPPDYKPILPVDPNTQLITFTLDNRCIFTLRTSGTEPKIKYYIEVSTEQGTKTTAEELRATLNYMVERVVEEFLMPDHYGLIPRPT